MVSVLKAGLPMYGDASVMEALGAGADGCELLSGCLAGKRACVTREGASVGATLAKSPASLCSTTASNPETHRPGIDQGDRYST